MSNWECTLEFRGRTPNDVAGYKGRLIAGLDSFDTPICSYDIQTHHFTVHATFDAASYVKAGIVASELGQRLARHLHELDVYFTDFSVKAIHAAPAEDTLHTFNVALVEGKQTTVRARHFRREDFSYLFFDHKGNVVASFPESLVVAVVRADSLSGPVSVPHIKREDDA